jgi:hypothetical protein
MTRMWRVGARVLKEIKMLLHLPIVVLAALSPIAVSDGVPRFDIAKECRFESESTKAFDRCSRDEADALLQLETEWPQFVGAERSACFAEATIDGLESYVELLTCLEMARDADSEKTNFRRPPVQSASPTPPEVSIVDKPE